MEATLTDATHFDRWGPDYDRDELHPVLVANLLDGITITAGARVLDVATGTGLVALAAAECVGSAGIVIGVDISAGMLAAARRKAQSAKLENVRFIEGDAESLTRPVEGFDYVFCSSALVLMADPPAALCLWASFLKPGGILAFDTPAKPFGISDLAVAAAARHGVKLAYADVGDTPAKCRNLVAATGLEAVSVRTVLSSSRTIDIATAVALYDDRLDHPAWSALGMAEPETRAGIRASYIEQIHVAAPAGEFLEEMALNVTIARMP